MPRIVRQPHDHQRFLTVEELRGLLAACGVRDRALFLCTYVFALRASELGLLARSDWRDARGELYVRRVKGSISATHAVPPAVDAALRAWDARRPVSRWLFPGRDPAGPRGISMEGVRTVFASACRRAGLSDRAGYPHILKHSRCTHLRQGGARPEAIQVAAGHKQLSSTFKYFQFTEEDARAIESVTRAALNSVVAPLEEP